MDPMPGGPLAGLNASLSAVLPPSGGQRGGKSHSGPSPHLNPLQFGKGLLGGLGGGGGEAAAAGGGAAGGEAALAEAAPLALAL